MADLEINPSDKLAIKGLLSVKKTVSYNDKFKQGDGPPNPNYSKRFIEFAEIDFEAARVLFDIQDRQYDFMYQAAFLCAQSTEKYLKSYLFYKSPELYKSLTGRQVLGKLGKLSHNIEKILDECLKINEDFGHFKELVRRINKYSLLKYPDVEDKMVYSAEGLTVSSSMLRDVESVGNFVKTEINEG